MARQDRLGTVATTATRDDAGVLRVTYHSTVIVTVYPKGLLILDHGGWMTTTTKTRMNQASQQFNLGYQVYQKDYRWYVLIDGHEIVFDRTPLIVRNGS